MKNKVFFSVIIPTYNRAALIVNTINSVLEQTWFDFEVIIIDDGSTDNTTDTVKILLADTRIRYYKMENSERGAARNYGVSKACGEYVTFLDSDDIFLPWHLATAAKHIDANEQLNVFHLGYEILHPNGRVDKLPLLPSPVNNKLLEGNFLSCMGVFLKREVALQNKFDEDRALSGSEDYELWMRIAARMPIVTFPEVTSRLINHESRSVIQVDPKKLIERIVVLDQKLSNDKFFREAFRSEQGKFNSYRTLYLSLHLAMCGERWQALRSLAHTAYAYPYVIFTYRFMVVVKKIVLW